MGRIEMGSLIVLGIAVISGAIAYGRLIVRRECERVRRAFFGL